MKRLAIASSTFLLMASAMAHGQPGWDKWSAGSRGAAESFRPRVSTPAVVPAGSATYTGSTVALINDTSSGSSSRSVSTGAVSMNVAFSGTGTTTQTGTITGLTGTAGATLGDLAFTGTGTGKTFSGTVTSTTYAATAATATTAATGTGKIAGAFTAPVVNATTSAVTAPQAVTGGWSFAATSTLKAAGVFAATR